MPRRISRLAKLTQPRLHGALARERLFDLLDENRASMAAIWVIAPPGAGKTTLVSSYLSARRIPGIWYQIDTGDADIASFFHYLRMAASPLMRKRQKPLPILKPEYLSDIRGFARRFFRDLFASLPHGSTLVFDDYQELPADHALHALMVDAINETPPPINVIIVSRSSLPEGF